MRLLAHLFYLNIIPNSLSLYATNLANRKNFREVYSVLLTKETEVELQTFWNVFQWWLWIENSQIVWHSRTVELSRSWWPIRSHNFGFPSSTQFYFPSRSFIRFIEKILLESAISVLNLLYLSNGYSKTWWKTIVSFWTWLPNVTKIMWIFGWFVEFRPA